MHKDEKKHMESENSLNIEKLIQRWGASSKLINHFNTLVSPCYKSSEIALLQDKFDWMTHPVSRDINQLLAAIIQFRSATDLGYFKQFRDATKTNEELLSVLNEVAKAIHMAQTERDQEAKNTPAFEIYSSAIDYAIKSIKNRLAGLKEINDKMYDLYMKENNELRKIIKE